MRDLYNPNVPADYRAHARLVRYNPLPNYEDFKPNLVFSLTNLIKVNSLLVAKTSHPFLGA
jgi:hypothetical protein